MHTFNDLIVNTKTESQIRENMMEVCSLILDYACIIVTPLFDPILSQISNKNMQNKMK